MKCDVGTDDIFVKHELSEILCLCMNLGGGTNSIMYEVVKMLCLKLISVCIITYTTRVQFGRGWGVRLLTNKTWQIVRELRMRSLFLWTLRGSRTVVYRSTDKRSGPTVLTYTEVAQYSPDKTKIEQLHNVLCFPYIWPCVKYLQVLICSMCFV